MTISIRIFQARANPVARDVDHNLGNPRLDFTQDTTGLNIPVSWGFVNTKIYYKSDFYSAGGAGSAVDSLSVPADAMIDAVATDALNHDQCVINIGELWRNRVPGLLNTSTTTTTESPFASAETTNQASVDKIKATIDRFRLTNTTTKIGWWGIPNFHRTNSIPGNKLAVQQDAFRFFGPSVASVEYNGVLELELWRAKQLEGYFDFLAPSSYFFVSIADLTAPDLTYEELYTETHLNYKKIAHEGYGLPVYYFLQPRLLNNNASLSVSVFPNDQQLRVLGFFDRQLEPGDAIGWWEDFNKASAMNAMLSNGTEDWITNWSAWSQA